MRKKTSPQRIRIAVDAMGGDSGPQPILEGIRAVAQTLPIEIVLVGDVKVLERFDLRDLPITVIPAEQVVGMDELPSQALRKRQDSSVALAVQAVKDGMAQAVFSAGNTGVTMAFAQHLLGRLPGVTRPAIASLFPTSRKEHPCLVMDVGANVDCRPALLVEFALMGKAYVQAVVGNKDPQVGLLSIGEEPTKGNELTLQAYRLLSEAPVHFVGNVEGHDVVNGTVDVVVCDGFVGNVILKFAEGLAELIINHLQAQLKELRLRADHVEAQSESLQRLLAQYDYAEYGAAPLLGVQGSCWIGHGRSSARAVASALRNAYQAVHAGLDELIIREMAACHAPVES